MKAPADPHDGADPGATARAALVVFVGYYLGSWIGFQLRLPPATTSVMWPPNAILTATLLMTRPGRWWVYLMAAFPAHVLIQIQTGLPLPLMFAFFATNCSEALLAAGLVHRLSDAQARFDTLRRAAIFILASVMIAPFASTFLDAGAVTWLQGEPYSVVWRRRFYSNTLTQLTWVPTLVALVRLSTRSSIWLRGRRAVEALLLAAMLVAVGTLVFAGPSHGPRLLPWSTHTALALLLPLLLWAATRFGHGGSSFALLTTALLAIATTTRGGVSVLPATEEGVLALQIFLLVVGVPLFLLGALIQERQATERMLGERLRFEALLARLTAAFVHLPSNAMDAAFESWLRHVGSFFGLEHVVLLRPSRDGEGLEVRAAWSVAGAEALAPARLLPRNVDGLLREPLLFSRQLAPPAVPSQRVVAAGRPLSWGLSFPLEAGSRLLGGMTFVGAISGAETHEESADRLRLVAEVFGSALARKETEDAVRASETMKSAILTSLSGQVAVLDRNGRIIAVNASWSRAARAAGAPAELERGVGLDYLEACRRAASSGLPEAVAAAAGIAQVLDGSLDSFALEYPCRTPTGERWFALSAVPLRRAEGGAVATHTDVTERRHAESEALHSREELAHFLRVSTVGELTTSLAHELNQPLTAILANAQAARMRLSNREPLGAGELDEILSDIIDEDKRAGEVIRRLRELLRKGEPERAPLAVNTIVAETAKLLGGDALLRNLTVDLDLSPALPLLNGDRIQLQQVVLNVMINAMEAMVNSSAGDRRILVRTSMSPEAIEVAVEDGGTGFPEGAEVHAFEPFFTTKPSGMGMGLSIARSIVEAHGGRIWAQNNPNGPGASVHVSLPLVRPGSGRPAYEAPARTRDQEDRPEPRPGAGDTRR